MNFSYILIVHNVDNSIIISALSLCLFIESKNWNSIE